MLLTIAAVAAILSGCSSGRNTTFQPQIDPELANLTKEEIFEKAEQEFQDERWTRARRWFAHVYENYPNDPLGRRSLLRVADTYFQQGDPVNLIEAQYKYRDFVNRYPASEQADYAMLQIAMVSYKQMERPDRDQTRTFETIEKLQEMIGAYPNSPLRPEAESRLREARDRLARHDHLVASFYLHRGNPRAALGRLNHLVETYPNYVDRDQVFFDLGRALEDLGRQGEARLYYERVVAEYPDSRWAQPAREKLEDLSA
ncbi:MAG TPA: outer membrane protein assembly factor BamD [Thermoanaerobaculia bacterium]|nr:outer membrane protein assembly factor BamD [Thermoanaerobaculia bacterium]